ncbi:MAG: tetratricopeptide repeat protein [Acidimicrobiia bacterium]
MSHQRRVGRVLVFISLVWMWAAAPLRAESPGEADPLEQAYLFWQAGYFFHLSGEFDKAILLFQRSIDVRPTAEAHTFLGWSLSKLGRFERAISECKKAIALDAEYGNPYNDIGVYLIELGRPDDAIPWLKQAVEAKRYCCYEFPHFNLGRILLEKGRIAEAKRSFERALSHRPSYLPALRALQLITEQGLEPL